MDESCGFIIETCVTNWCCETCNAKDTGEFTEILGRRHREAVRLSQGYMLTFDLSQQWELEQGHFVMQVEGYNCGPIACLVTD